MIRLRSLLWCLGTICMAAIVSFFVAREASREHEHSGHREESETTFHDWLHENLEITPEQEKLLFPFELNYEKDRERIRKNMESAGLTLADAIRNFDADSAEVAQAREKLTSLQGELQQATLDHFFAMKQHLSEEQGEKLLRWTHDSIIHGHHN